MLGRGYERGSNAFSCAQLHSFGCTMQVSLPFRAVSPAFIVTLCALDLHASLTVSLLAAAPLLGFMFTLTGFTAVSPFSTRSCMFSFTFVSHVLGGTFHASDVSLHCLGVLLRVYSLINVASICVPAQGSKLFAGIEAMLACLLQLVHSPLMRNSQNNDSEKKRSN